MEMETEFLKKHWGLVAGTAGLIGMTALSAANGEWGLSAAFATVAAMLSGTTGMMFGMKLVERDQDHGRQQQDSLRL